MTIFPVKDDKVASHLIFGEGEREDEAARILLRNVLETGSLAQDHLLGAADSALDDLDLVAVGDIDLNLDLAAGDVEPCLDESPDDLLLIWVGDLGLAGEPEIEREFLGLPHSLDFDLCPDIDLERDLDFDLEIDLDADLDIDLEGDLDTESGRLDLDLDLDIVKARCLDTSASTELA